MILSKILQKFKNSKLTSQFKRTQTQKELRSSQDKAGAAVKQKGCRR